MNKQIFVYGEMSDQHPNDSFNINRSVDRDDVQMAVDIAEQNNGAPNLSFEIKMVDKYGFDLAGMFCAIANKAYGGIEIDQWYNHSRLSITNGLIDFGAGSTVEVARKMWEDWVL